MIWFDLQDMGFSHCPCYWLLGRTNWASFLGRRQDLGRFTGLALSLSFGGWAFVPIFKPYQYVQVYLNVVLSWEVCD